ncbi:clavesin-1 [Trichonephila inaurata madagascariensis]|uniref:Clavesin-1 n=1 Tax=Trichonephila inaurata madagascariensis TaxID=2747483 RepID=A0A8X7BW34_9ARAC|nr:clavesin-1 [Trichonephila inaurata madagascariensis]
MTNRIPVGDDSLSRKERIKKMFIRDPETARIGEEILPFEIDQLPEFFEKKAEVELRDNPERRLQGLRQIKELAKSNFSCLLHILKITKNKFKENYSPLPEIINLDHSSKHTKDLVNNPTNL